MPGGDLNVADETFLLSGAFPAGIARKWSFKLAARLLNIVGAATSAGAYAPGQERAPRPFGDMD
jgi:arginase